MTNSELDFAFKSTDYIVLKNEIIPSDVILKIGIVNDINGITKISEWVFITAWNPLPEILSDAENIKRNNELFNELLSLGYVCHLGKGVSSDGKWQEDSFFIENINRNTALSLANKYGQLAFVYGTLNTAAELVYSSTI